MTKSEVLNQLNQKKISKREAYRLLYGQKKERKPRQASFVKLSIRIPEERGITLFLGFLFFLPIPIFLFKLFLRGDRRLEISDGIELEAKELIRLISVRGAKIQVKTHDKMQVSIRTL